MNAWTKNTDILFLQYIFKSFITNTWTNSVLLIRAMSGTSKMCDIWVLNHASFQIYGFYHNILKLIMFVKKRIWYKTNIAYKIKCCIYNFIQFGVLNASKWTLAKNKWLKMVDLYNCISFLKSYKYIHIACSAELVWIKSSKWTSFSRQLGITANIARIVYLERECNCLLLDWIQRKQIIIHWA